ncbi:BnaC09g14490D [Brassica napus]|uniref:BnaC09g14490D protein n=1 Tax=Brassica napus TaxID=3708 RepID=A0A078HRZ8_BRANA|nr:BnaC09g14490D [Brassica napus]
MANLAKKQIVAKMCLLKKKNIKKKNISKIHKNKFLLIKLQIMNIYIYIYTQIYTQAQPPTPPPVPPPASPQTPPLAPDATSEAATRSASGATGVTDEATRHACSAITLLLLPHRSFSFFTLQAGSAHESRATTTSANSSSINLLCLFYHYAEKLRWRPARRPENIQKK